MAIYVVGDVQGCFLTFQKLLDEIKFDNQVDQIILLGDVINRGPRSLPMLRFVKNNLSSVRMVLGNHEIFAIALALAALKTTRAHTLQDLLAASDKIELIEFLRAQPLMMQIDDAIFVHAGILPAIPIPLALNEALAVRDILMSNNAAKFLERFYEKIPTSHKPTKSRKRSLRFALAYFTLLRMCESPSVMDLTYNGEIDKAPKRLKPWFMLRNDPDYAFYFGHWAALGFHQYQRYTCLDSGCVWGKKLSAMRLSDQKLYQISNVEGI